MPKNSGLPMDSIQRLVDDLARQDWALTNDLIPLSLVRELRDELRSSHRASLFRPAGIGKGASLKLRPEIRSDHVMWLEAPGQTGPQQAFWAAIEFLRPHLNRELFLNLKEFEGHMTVYPPGAGYAKHLDQFRETSNRQISFVLYLNENWRAEDGGQLVIYRPGSQDEIAVEIQPEFGTIALFSSARVWHEVRPTQRERYSLTGWFRTAPSLF